MGSLPFTSSGMTPDKNMGPKSELEIKYVPFALLPQELVAIISSRSSTRFSWSWTNSFQQSPSRPLSLGSGDSSPSSSLLARVLLLMDRSSWMHKAPTLQTKSLAPSKHSCCWVPPTILAPSGVFINGCSTQVQAWILWDTQPFSLRASHRIGFTPPYMLPSFAALS